MQNNADMEASLKKVIIDMDARHVYDLLSNIVDEDIVFFNMDSDLCKPVDMMITCIPAPPACIRPTVAVANGKKNQDDLTIKLSEIIQRND